MCGRSLLTYIWRLTFFRPPILAHQFHQRAKSFQVQVKTTPKSACWNLKTDTIYWIHTDQSHSTLMLCHPKLNTPRSTSVFFLLTNRSNFDISPTLVNRHFLKMYLPSFIDIHYKKYNFWKDTKDPKSWWWFIMSIDSWVHNIIAIASPTTVDAPSNWPQRPQILPITPSRQNLTWTFNMLKCPIFLYFYYYSVEIVDKISDTHLALLVFRPKHLPIYINILVVYPVPWLLILKLMLIGQAQDPYGFTKRFADTHT